jgi:hypothetical protein
MQGIRLIKWTPGIVVRRTSSSSREAKLLQRVEDEIGGVSTFSALQ